MVRPPEDVIRAIDDLSPASRDAFDAIIDVRSPAEYAADHVPGAINLPALSNAERAEVGTIYVQRSHFEARRLGAAYVSASIARHLEQALADRGAGFRPLVYCWRGGMRSHAFATVFAEIGWRTAVVDGGYRRWRRQVVALFHGEEPLPYRFVLLDGPTGVGKTAMLGQLQKNGAQVLDLEQFARHRGSLFGAMPEGQPGQKLFESALFDALARLDPARPVLAEAESSRVGEIALPRALWMAMERAPRILLRAATAARVRHILEHYCWIATDEARLEEAIRRLPSHHGNQTKERWQDFARKGELAVLVRELIERHYDPAYARSAGRRGGPVLGTIDLDHEPDAVARIMALVAATAAGPGPGVPSA